MPAKFSANLRGASLIAGGLLAFVGAPGATLPADAFPTFESYIKFSGQAPWITGNDAAFQKRLQTPANGGTGIEDLHFTKDYEKAVSLTIDGRALTGAEDYLGKINLSKKDVGSVEVGYKSFRTFYDGIGGFFPLSKRWNALNPEDLHVDRGEFWADARVAVPNAPEFEIRFTDGFRRGKKDTTVWGDSDFTGLPNNNPPISQVRKMIPSYRDLDEHHQDLAGSMKHSMGKTTLNLVLQHEKTDDIDTRYASRFPGEIKPFPIPASTVLLPPGSTNNQIIFSQTDGMKTKLNAATARTETVFNEKFTLELGLNCQDLDSDFTGNRPLYTSTPTAIGAVIAPSNNYLNLAGGSKVRVYTGTTALEWKPGKNSLVKLALRGEDKYTRSTGSLTAVAATVNATTGAVTTTNSDQIFNSRVKEKSLTPTLDLRYSGFKDLALYASASVRKVGGDERYVTPYNPVTTSVIPNGNQAFNSTSEDRTRMTVGANWHTSTVLTIRSEVFHKENTNKAVGYIKRTDGFVDNYDLGYNYNGVKLTAIVKPAAAWSFTTRYVYQKGRATVTSAAVTGSTSAGYVATFPEYDSMDMSNHMIGETIDWTPTTQFYAQANANVVFNVINTIYPRAGIAPASGTSIAFDVNNVLHNSDNNYVTASMLAGAVLTKKDDLQVQYTYYRADNYNPAMASLTMPYGAGAKESVATISVKHKFSDRCLGNAKIGYFDSKNDTTGGNTNFRGPLAYVSLEYAL